MGFTQRLHRGRWRVVGRLIRERDKYRCRKCGKAGRLEVDHKKPIRQGGDPWAFENLQCLCRGCHIEKTRGEQRAAVKVDPDRQAWRDRLAKSANLAPLAKV